MQIELTERQIYILKDLVNREYADYGSSSPVLLNLLQTLSPVSNVPNIGAGDPNNTPSHNLVSNGVPVSNDYDEVYTCSECGHFTDSLVGAGSRCCQCVDEMGG